MPDGLEASEFDAAFKPQCRNSCWNTCFAAPEDRTTIYFGANGMQMVPIFWHSYQFCNILLAPSLHPNFWLKRPRRQMARFSARTRPSIAACVALSTWKPKKRSSEFPPSYCTFTCLGSHQIFSRLTIQIWIRGNSWLEGTRQGLRLRFLFLCFPALHWYFSSRYLGSVKEGIVFLGAETGITVAQENGSFLQKRTMILTYKLW